MLFNLGLCAEIHTYHMSEMLSGGGDFGIEGGK